MEIDGQKKMMRILRVFGALSGVACIILGIVGFTTLSLNPRTIVNNIYLIFFGIVAILCELRLKALLAHFYFLQHFFGLGAFYIFIGGISLGGEWYYFVVAAVLLSVGIVYCTLGCMCRTMSNEYGENPGAGPMAQSSSADSSSNEPSRLGNTYASPTDQWSTKAAHAAIDNAQSTGGLSSWEAHVAKAAVPSAIQGMRSGGDASYGAW